MATATPSTTNTPQRAKFYVGLPYGQGKLEVFKSVVTPTKANTPHFMAVIGPFRTKRGANYMAENRHNPCCQCVSDAERLAKLCPSYYDETPELSPSERTPPGGRWPGGIMG
jgi:hypothetical protein